ncbi:hypothetical protein [Rhodococcus gordoniae]|uniref:hypothetical protein n=1 Tax=Rhodococcus gordoniae TaxID=223392 RepID=UPI001FD743A7|nr:hypothetical protein [Rhodococcus gordoniae]
MDLFKPNVSASSAALAGPSWEARSSMIETTLSVGGEGLRHELLSLKGLAPTIK